MPNLHHNNLDSKLEILYSHISSIVLKLFEPYLGFAKTTYKSKVYKILALTFNLLYNSLHFLHEDVN